MTSTLTKPLPGTARVVSDVRQLVRTALLGLPPGVVDDATTTASELATNALRHTRSGSPGGEFVLCLEVAEAFVSVAVTDQGRDDDHGPEVNPEGAIEGGMGLGICQTLGALTITGGPHGRRVAVRLAFTEAKGAQA